MRAIIQRVNNASVSVDGNITGECKKGYLVLLGIGKGDDEMTARKLCDKIVKMRIFNDENGKINLSLLQVGGEMLVVSQFTLFANCSHGNRPEFFASASPDEANRLYEYFVSYARTLVPRVETGIFGACMQVSLENDGPFTLYLDTEMLK